MAAQVKLLRALQEGTVEAVGARKAVKVDVRIMSATNRRLLDHVKQGHFREDLYYRLHVLPVTVPPLRERRDDIPHLARHFLARFCAEEKRSIGRVTPEAMALLMHANWPGNIRQLENHVKKALVLADGPALTARDLDLEIDMPGSAGAPIAIAAPEQILPLTEARELWQRDYINHVLGLNNGNRTKTARDLGVDPRTIFRHLEKEEKK